MLTTKKQQQTEKRSKHSARVSSNVYGLLYMQYHGYQGYLQSDVCPVHRLQRQLQHVMLVVSIKKLKYGYRGTSTT